MRRLFKKFIGLFSSNKERKLVPIDYESAHYYWEIHRNDSFSNNQ